MELSGEKSYLCSNRLSSLISMKRKNSCSGIFRRYSRAVVTCIFSSRWWLGIIGWLPVFLFAQSPVDYVCPFVGTANYGTTHPGALCPNGLMSVVPFNVMGSDLNRYDKDSRWWSAPYAADNVYFTGYSHVNLSGVGCPELSALLVMPTSGDPLRVDFREYGSRYEEEQASPGYYANRLTDYNIRTEVTATPRTALHRYTYPAGKGHLLLNLGEGLTNETGATVKRVTPYEVEGVKLMGTFCYETSQAVFPLYFVLRVRNKELSSGYWKFQRPKTGIEADWDPDDGHYKLYTRYGKELSGDDIGVWFSFDTAEGEQLEVEVGVSLVSIANARENLQRELEGRDFDEVAAAARKDWDEALSRIKVEGGTEEQKRVFYTALYHTLIHPNLIQDVNGEYPAMEGEQILTTSRNRYSVYSLWDTYRNVHQLLTLVYPRRQLDMVRTMLDMYRESGWLPKWELYGRETYTMDGDPAVPVLADTWLKGVRDFDIELAYEAMRKGAMTPGKDNPLRPENDAYMEKGYVPSSGKVDYSVSSALEYYVADHALSLLAADLGRKEDAERFRRRALGYRHYYCPEYGTLRPKLADGTFYAPFSPRQGEHFEPCPGFHEGSAWNYTFFVPHDVRGLARLMGGKKEFVQRLQKVFDEGLYDPTNEPDIAYPYLFSYFKGEEWRTQRLTRQLLRQHFTSREEGLPGNDDAGAMSAWAVFSMMGFYPDCPGAPEYTFTAPVFEKITIRLDTAYYPQPLLVIEAPYAADTAAYIHNIEVGGKRHKGFRISHRELVKAGNISMKLQPYRPRRH